MIKVMEVFKRKEGLSREEFSKHWREVFAPLALKYSTQLGVKRYIQNHIMSQLDAAEPEFDGIVEVWYENMDAFNAFRNFIAGEDSKMIRDEEQSFVDSTKHFIFVVEENLVL